MPDNITTSPSTPTLFNRESIKQSLIKNSDFKATDADNIAKAITAKLEKDNKGKKNYTEEDVFKAASSIYKFDNGANHRLLNAIDLLDGEVNTNNGTSKATWQAISGNPDGDSRNIVNRSMERLTKNEQEVTLANIIADLDKSVFKDGQNPGLKKILEAAQEKGTTSEQLKEAVKDDAKWLELIGDVKGAKPKSKPESP